MPAAAVEAKGGYIIPVLNLRMGNELIPISMQELDLCDYVAVQLHPPLKCPVKPGTYVQYVETKVLKILNGIISDLLSVRKHKQCIDQVSLLFFL